MIAALTSLKRYFYEKADRQEDSDFYYFRTRTPPDDTDFQPCVTENRNGAFSGIKYFFIFNDHLFYCEFFIHNFFSFQTKSYS